MSDPQPNHFSVAAPPGFAMGLGGQPGMQQQLNALAPADQQAHLQGLDQRDPRQVWSQLQLNHHLARQNDGAMGQPQMNTVSYQSISDSFIALLLCTFTRWTYPSTTTAPCYPFLVTPIQNFPFPTILLVSPLSVSLFSLPLSLVLLTHSRILITSTR